MAPVIKVTGLTKEFGHVKAVNGVDLSIEPGRIFGLIGPNGAGKTTIIKSLTGQITPSSGRLEVLGLDPSADPVGVRKAVGIIPEQESPPSFLTGGEYLSFVAEVRGLGGIESEKERWFRMMDFAGQANVLCKDMSRGTRQKLMVAQAFLHKPKVVFIDEPLVNLDPIAQKRLKDHLRGYVTEGNTVFMSSHMLESVEELCDEVAVLDRGKVVAEGLLKDLLEDRGHLDDLFMRLVGAENAP
jgi:ABC-2 type transport system ATP-binding protein